MLPTDEVLEALKESILLPFVLTIFDRDKKAIERAGVKYPKVYLELIELAEKCVLADLRAHKQQMRKAGMKVIEEKRSELDMRVEYMYRGYRHTATYMWAFLGAEAEVRVMRYLTPPNKDT